MVKRLEKLAQIGRASAEDLSSLHKHGAQASTLGQEAQETIASLIRLSNKALDSITGHRIHEQPGFPRTAYTIRESCQCILENI
jgi:hypothetical protein